MMIGGDVVCGGRGGGDAGAGVTLVAIGGRLDQHMLRHRLSAICRFRFNGGGDGGSGAIADAAAAIAIDSSLHFLFRPLMCSGAVNSFQTRQANVVCPL